MPYIDLTEVIRNRAMERLPWAWLHKKHITRGYFAGSGLLRAAPNDIDLFPAYADKFNILDTEGRIAYTANADTFSVDGQIIQLCNYAHPSLEALVDSFDFAHVQVGAEFELRLGPDITDWDCVLIKEIKKVYLSENFKTAMAAETTFYTGSEFPLSSLMRVVKYSNRGMFPGRAYIPTIIDILDNILQRGYNGYDDFKDQLDAVDLGMLESDFNRDTLLRIFNALNKGDKEC